MKTITAILAVALPLLTAISIIRGLLQRPARQLPPERDDGVVVANLTTETVSHPTVEELHRRWRREAVELVGLLALGAFLVLVRNKTNPFLLGVLIGEAAFVVPINIYRVVTHRRLDPGKPVDTCRATVAITGSLDAVTQRLTRAFMSERALWAKGSTISMDRDYCLIEGGTGFWGASDDEGYQLRATVRRAGERWEISIESANYVPSILQGVRNARNVNRVLYALLA